VTTEQLLDVAEVLAVRCDVCDRGSEAASLGAVHLATSGDVVFVPLERMPTAERNWYAAQASDPDLTAAERARLRSRYVEGSAQLVDAEGLRLRCWAGHEVGPGVRRRGASIYMGAST
jgi:hypothetical protein